MVARRRQWQRQSDGGVAGPNNARLSMQEAEQVCQLSSSGRALIRQATTRLGLSARAYLRILRVGRTIADLEGTEGVSDAQLGEAIQGRLVDRDMDR
jgi:magnesium chelatase family protein